MNASPLRRVAEEGGYYYFLTPVGEPLTLSYARANVRKLFQALKELHDKTLPW